MDSLRYLRLKSAALAYRTAWRLYAGTPAPQPDDILTIPSRDHAATGHTITIHVYRPSHSPTNPKDSNTTPTPTPVLLNFHGSGFLLHNHGSDALFCRHIASRTPYTVLDVDYRKGPEFLFPLPLFDAQDALAYVRARPEVYDCARLAVSGFSAGGTVALALALGAADGDAHGEGGGAAGVEKVVLVYPLLDNAAAGRTKQAFDRSGVQIPGWLLDFFGACWVPASFPVDCCSSSSSSSPSSFSSAEQTAEDVDASPPALDARDPRISPCFAHVSRYPPHILGITAAYDNLAPEMEGMAERIRQESGGKVKVAVERFEGVGHAWDKDTRDEDTESDKAVKRDRAYELVGRFLRGDI